MIDRGVSYLQCVLITRISRAGAVTDEELYQLAGPYATNVIGALRERGFIHRAGVRWELAGDGLAIAHELLGDAPRSSSTLIVDRLNGERRS